MARLSELPFELRELIWLLSRPPSIHVTARKVTHPAQFFIFDVRLIHDKPPCKEALIASQRAAQLHRKTATSTRKHSSPISFNPYLCPIYLHCDSAQGSVEFIFIYPGLKVTSIGDPKPAGSFVGRDSTGNLSMVQGQTSIIDGEQAAIGPFEPRKKRCPIVGCDIYIRSGTLHQIAKEAHMRKKHGGPLNGKCPVVGCYHFTSCSYTRERHWDEYHHNQQVWRINHRM